MTRKALLLVLVVLFLLAPSLSSSLDRAVNPAPPDGTRLGAGSLENMRDRGYQPVTYQDNNALLQFRAGGHVLGFEANKAYLASLDHALSVEFLGTKGVTPAQGGPRIGEATDARALGAVHYKNLWEGISLTYEATEKGIAESTYHVAPKADVSSIRFRYNVPVDLQKDGSLRFRFERGFLTESAPVAWQEIGEKRVPVEVAFKVSQGEVGFRVGKYDPRYPLTIDPTYAWHTFYGTNSDEIAYGIAVDGNGNIYVAAVGYVTWNGPAGQAPLHAYSGGGDFLVLKLNSSGVYQWHTFYGSSLGSAYAYGITADGNGSVYVTGNCNRTWNGPGTPGTAPLHAFTGSDYGLFVLKLDTNGAYQWHTFYGGGGNAIALDGGGGVYVTGSSAAWNGPSGQAPLHAFTTSLPGWNYGDLVVLKLDTNGAYQWHTFYGASGGSEIGRAIAVGGGGVYVTGFSSTSWTGASAAAPLHAYSGGSMGNVFVLKLNGNGAYQWHTFYGTTNGSTAYGVAADSNGNVYVAGSSYDSWNGPSAQVPLHGFSGNPGFMTNILVMKLDNSGAYQWHTYYGSATVSSKVTSIGLDASGGVYAVGDNGATWTGPAGQAPLHAYGSGYNIGLLKLDGNGAYQWHDFYGSPATVYTNGIAVTGPDIVHLTGYTTSSWNGPAGQAPLHARTGSGSEIHVLKLGPVAPVVTTTAVSGITMTAATSGGNVTSDGGSSVTARGVCWSTSVNPTTANSCTSDSTGTGPFASTITGLIPNTPYHVRAYATNSQGTAYGNDVQFTSGPAISLAQGWNFISFPKLPVNNNVAAVLADVSSNVSIVWGYDNENKLWKKWKVEDQQLTSLEFGKGYWIYMSEAGYAGTAGWLDHPTNNVTLYEGWSLVGYQGINGTAATTALNDISGNWVIVWAWDNSVWSGKHPTIQTLPPPFQPLSLLNQGKAYWIRTKQGTGSIVWAQ